jgi:hypothetical protein
MGRDNKCAISFPGDKSFSKIQLTIKYNNLTKTWILIDGIDDKPSTNGTWYKKSNLGYSVHILMK